MFNLPLFIFQFSVDTSAGIVILTLLLTAVSLTATSVAEESIAKSLAWIRLAGTLFVATLIELAFLPTAYLVQPFILCVGAIANIFIVARWFYGRKKPLSGEATPETAQGHPVSGNSATNESGKNLHVGRGTTS